MASYLRSECASECLQYLRSLAHTEVISRQPSTPFHPRTRDSIKTASEGAAGDIFILYNKFSSCCRSSIMGETEPLVLFFAWHDLIKNDAIEFPQGKSFGDLSFTKYTWTPRPWDSLLQLESFFRKSSTLSSIYPQLTRNVSRKILWNWIFRCALPFIFLTKK